VPVARPQVAAKPCPGTSSFVPVTVPAGEVIVNVEWNEVVT
jgi:hypothetical protein